MRRVLGARRDEARPEVVEGGLDDDAREPVLIKTVRSEGYMLAADVERQA